MSVALWIIAGAAVVIAVALVLIWRAILGNSFMMYKLAEALGFANQRMDKVNTNLASGAIHHEESKRLRQELNRNMKQLAEQLGENTVKNFKLGG